MWEQILPALRINLFATVVFGLVYPLAVTGICQLFFPHQANGTLVRVGGKVVGSELIGQNFARSEYFHPRPSSAGNGYDASASGGSNLGPTSAKLIRGTTKVDDKKNEIVEFDGISLRLVHFCLGNDIPYESSVPMDRFKDSTGSLDDVKLIKAFNDAKAPLEFRAKVPIPADAITASGSGLDPHISPESASMQAARVAKARGANDGQVRSLIGELTESPTFGVLGDPRVNVLRLNVALDQRFPLKR